MINFPDSIEEAYKRSKPHIRKTPLEHSPYLSNLINGNVYVSEISITETGSIRGTLEANVVEINGHIEGKLVADSIIIGKICELE